MDATTDARPFGLHAQLSPFVAAVLASSLPARRPLAARPGPSRCWLLHALHAVPARTVETPLRAPALHWPPLLASPLLASPLSAWNCSAVLCSALPAARPWSP